MVGPTKWVAEIDTNSVGRVRLYFVIHLSFFALPMEVVDKHDIRKHDSKYCVDL